MRQQKITITREKNKDIGFVILLGLLLWYFHSGNILLLYLSVLCVLVSLLIPVILKPVSFAWYGLSETMGTIISRALLSAIFFCIVTPIGVARRLISKKRLQTEQWKKSRESVFEDRNVCFTISDIKNPF
jgi:cellulose synthase/poly-beta-1,6-N-acetylglucosamine synthase-like glycosyltransferase